MAKRKTEYTRHYRGLCGVEMSGTGDSTKGRLAQLENMYRDWQGDGGTVLESIPGYRRITSLGGAINHIYAHRGTRDGDCLLIHAGRSLYRLPRAERDSTGALSPICTLSGEYSRGFAGGESFYLIDGEGMVRIDREGVAHRIGIDEEAYAPTTFIEGERYEERNLISQRCIERITISDPNSYAFGSKGLIYSVTDTERKLCAVEGGEEYLALDVHIPNRVEIGGETYLVTEIKDNAFAENNQITSLRIAEGVEKIGKFAFFNCIYLEKVELPSSLKFIDNGAFSGCANLSKLYIKMGLEKLGLAVFAVCPSLRGFHYSGYEDELLRIENIGEITHLNITYGSRSDALRIAIPLYSVCSGIESVTVGGEPVSFKIFVKGYSVKWALIEPERAYELGGKEIVITGILKTYTSLFGRSGREEEIEGKSAVLGCRICESLDGRIFLSGNPRLPNTVFYTKRRADGTLDPTYVGESCYFNDGIGGYPVTAMLAVRDSLAIFKAGDDGGGSIFYHTARSTGDDLLPTIYPVTAVHSGVGAVGGAVNFLDDPVFLSPLGLTALTKKGIDSERSLAVRSESVNYDLLKEPKEALSMTEWQGYLVIGSEGKIYLADSRSTYHGKGGDTQYDWFTLSGVGTYEGSERVYRYASVSPEGYLTSDTPDEVCRGVVYSEDIGEGLVYFTPTEAGKFALYPTEELVGGEFSPAISYLGIDEHLFFGTRSGVLCLFNLDKRGVPPERLSRDPGFDPTDYARRMGRQIHPDFYSFDGHAPRYSLVTHYDDCGIPHLTKSTVKRSMVIKCRMLPRTELHLEVGTDRSDYREVVHLAGSEPDFTSLDFSTLTLSSEELDSLPVAESEKKWVEKQITVFSDSFASPIGIYSISYRFTVAGRVKIN